MKSWVLPLLGFILGITLANTVPTGYIPWISIGLAVLLLMFAMRNTNTGSKEAAKNFSEWWKNRGIVTKALIILAVASIAMSLLCGQHIGPQTVCKYFGVMQTSALKGTMDSMKSVWASPDVSGGKRLIAWDGLYETFYSGKVKQTNDIRCYAEKLLYSKADDPQCKDCTWHEFFYGKGTDSNPDLKGKIPNVC